MAYPISEKISIFTPVETECKFSSLPARYLSPLFCNKEIAVFDATKIDAQGNQGCSRKNDDSSFAMTALKVASYILSLGILPLLAILLNLVIRTGAKYYYTLDSNRPAPLSPLPRLPSPIVTPQRSPSADSDTEEETHSATSLEPSLPTSWKQEKLDAITLRQTGYGGMTIEELRTEYKSESGVLQILSELNPDPDFVEAHQTSVRLLQERSRALGLGQDFNSTSATPEAYDPDAMD